MLGLHNLTWAIPWRYATVMSKAKPSGRRLPRLVVGPRRRHFWSLIANGGAQVVVAMGTAVAVMWFGDVRGGGGGWGFVAVLAVLAAAQITLRALELRQAERLGQSFVQETRIALLKSAVRAVRPPNHGIAMTRLVNDLTSLKNWVALGVARSIVAALSLTGCLTAASIIDPRLALALALPVAALLALILGLFAPVTRRTREARRERGRLAACVGGVMLDRCAIEDRATEKASLRRVSRRGKRMGDALVRRMGLVGVLRAAPDAAAPLAILGFIAAGSDLSGANAVGALMLAMLISAPLRTLARAVEYRTAFLEARRRIEEALNAPRRRLSPRGEDGENDSDADL